jgi:A/G-specific adenine glycosylase
MKDFADKLIDWYSVHKRELPWRNQNDPYLIWLSEVILQQTRVSQGLPYYLRFVEEFPTVHVMAQADESQVLRLWQGLGYYSRARNMLGTARIIAHERNGKFPESYQELLKFKGIGTYTAAAIASLAYEEKVAVVDGNVYRVLSRIFGIEDDITSTQGKKKFAQLADQLMPDARISTYNQAIMEFGALHCRPQNPDCQDCIFASVCEAFRQKKQNVWPVKARKTKVLSLQMDYLLIESEEKLWLKERIGKGIWQGLYDFPLIEEGTTSDANLMQLYGRFPTDETAAFAAGSTYRFSEIDFQLVSVSNTYSHQLSHRDLSVRFFHLRISSQAAFDRTFDFAKEGRWYSISEIKALPKPILIANYLEDYFF